MDYTRCLHIFLTYFTERSSTRNGLYRTHVSRKRYAVRHPSITHEILETYMYFFSFFSRKTLTIINNHDSRQRPLVSRRKIVSLSNKFSTGSRSPKSRLVGFIIDSLTELKTKQKNVKFFIIIIILVFYDKRFYLSSPFICQPDIIRTVVAVPYRYATTE